MVNTLVSGSRGLGQSRSRGQCIALLRLAVSFSIQVYEAPSTLIRFRTKTELFCSVFEKICVHTYRFHIVFARPHYNAVSILKTLLYPSAHAQMNSTYAHFNISAREIGAILDTHGRVVWRPVVSILMTSPFSDSIVFSVHTRKQCFQKASFSNRSTLESVFEWLRFWSSFLALQCGRQLYPEQNSSVFV